MPFLLYYVPGGTHAPHHPTPEWIKKATDLHLFDNGWNAVRDQIFANQKRLGVIPQDAKLTAWPNDLLKTWDTLSADEKKMFIRQADVYAAYLMYTDHEIGRVVQAVQDLDKANAEAPSHRTQYFEMMGVYGFYNDGWMLSAVPIRPPWEIVGAAIESPATAYKMELYDIRHDWTQSNDVAAANPNKVKEMTDLMFGEFAKYQVLPIDASAMTRWVSERPSVTARRKEFAYSMPVTGLPDSVAPQVLNTSFTITADIDVPQGGGEGSIVAEGGRFGGYGLYLLKGKPVFTYNHLDLKRDRWEGAEGLSPGRHTIVFDFKYNGLGFGTLAFNNLSGIGRPATARSLRRRRWRIPFHWPCRSMRLWTSARRPARRWTIAIIKPHSRSPAS
jgi:hypothetical protein